MKRPCSGRLRRLIAEIGLSAFDAPLLWKSSYNPHQDVLSVSTCAQSLPKNNRHGATVSYPRMAVSRIPGSHRVRDQGRYRRFIPAKLSYVSLRGFCRRAEALVSRKAPPNEDRALIGHSGKTGGRPRKK
jgi:hypothetical protein